MAPAAGTPRKRLQALVLALIAASGIGLDFSQPLAWLSLALALLAAFKLAEARRRRERRLVALLQLLLCGLLAAQQAELVPSLLQLLAALGALAGLVQQGVEAGLSWRLLLRRSLRLALAALPLALLLWALVPRLGPLWQLPQGFGSRAVTGLSADLDPGGIAELASSDAAAARVAFSRGLPPPPSQRYWRVLVHPRFDGRRWLPAPEPLPRYRRLRPAAAAPSQLWLVEPGSVQPMPWDGASLPTSAEAWIDATGSLQLARPAGSRRSLLLVADPRAAAWQRLPPTRLDLELPWGQNPKLEALGRSWRSLPPPQRLEAARRLLGNGAYRYSRRPGRLPARAGLDSLLFDRRQGFCGHYASAFSALMRAAGVPARVVSGYQGGSWVPLLGGGGYLDLRQSDAHAWSEVWLQGRWQGVDPSAWLLETDGAGGGASADGTGWWARLQGQWWGLELAWSRWWLGFDASGQQQLLAWLLGDRQAWLPWALPPAAAALVLLGWLGLAPARAARRGDRLSRRLRRWRRGLARQGITIQAGETLPQLARRLADSHPQLAAQARRLALWHEQQRFRESDPLLRVR